MLQEDFFVTSLHSYQGVKARQFTSKKCAEGDRSVLVATGVDRTALLKEGPSETWYQDGSAG